MYISPIPNRKSPPAILLRESFRKNGKVKNRTLANLSHWDPARIEALRRALRGDFDHVEPCEAALGPIFGMLYVLKQIAEALGIAGVLGNTRLAKLGLFLILARVAHQGSRLSAVRWAADHAVSEVQDQLVHRLVAPDGLFPVTKPAPGRVHERLLQKAASRVVITLRVMGFFITRSVMTTFDRAPVS